MVLPIFKSQLPSHYHRVLSQKEWLSLVVILGYTLENSVSPSKILFSRLSMPRQLCYSLYDNVQILASPLSAGFRTSLLWEEMGSILVLLHGEDTSHEKVHDTLETLSTSI
jgi:hypothetical protein